MRFPQAIRPDRTGVEYQIIRRGQKILQFQEQLEHITFYVIKNAVLVLDNSPIHKSKLVQKLLTAKPYLFLPPYSPQLNPIEKIWNIFNAHSEFTQNDSWSFQFNYQ
ncbi:unnamed protein product [Paramecium pentaurelia]|uniref:Tc1-like transposase DDE domain-containing protein n=1 Tax=Paramecium pentaurelia TaxID=43138 RepID=A0A8S1WIH6_9CILI|nr:unnamed protein product [Paramecium pentaurelia]